MPKKSESNQIETGVNYKYLAIKSFFSRLLQYKRLIPKRSQFDYTLLPFLSIETTNACLSKCVFCAYQYMQRPRQHLDMNIFKKAVDEYARMGGVELLLNTVLGEPTCDPYLLERIAYVKKYPELKTFGFVTNLQNLHNLDITELVNSTVTWLGISIVLSGKMKYYEFFGVDLYDQVLKNLNSLLTENQKYGDKINITIDVKPTNEARKNIINHPDFKFINQLVKQDLVAAVENMHYFVDDWCGVVKLPAYLKRRPLYQRSFLPCRLLSNSVAVFSNGNVGICSCRDYNADSELILGNLKEISLTELLKSEKRFKFFSNWLENNRIPEICRRCTHYIV